MTSSNPAPRRARTVGLAAALALGAALSGCSAFGGGSGTSTYTGAPVAAGSPRSGLQAGSAPAPSASGAASGAASAPAGGAKTAPKPYVATVKKGTCSPQSFVRSAGLVSGAITTYITKPLTASSVSKAATTRAASAATYAAVQLGAGVKAVESCPTAKALAGVSKQNVTALRTLSSALRAGTVDQQKVDAVNALFGDVTAQASRLKLTITPKAPAASEL